MTGRQDERQRTLGKYMIDTVGSKQDHKKNEQDLSESQVDDGTYRSRSFNFMKLKNVHSSENTTIFRHSGTAVYLCLFHSSQDSTDYRILQLEDFLHPSLFPDLLPQPIGGFINNIFRG